MVDEPKVTLKVKLDNIFQMISNKVTSWSQTPSNDKYPSEKLVKDSLDGKANSSHNHDDRYYTETEIDGKLTIFDDSTNNASAFENSIYISQNYGSVGEISFGKLGYSMDNDLMFYDKGYGLEDDEIATIKDIPNIKGKENTSNKVTSLSSSSTDTQYPSAKLVYNQLNNKAPTSHASSSTTYGVATSSKYGHTKVINNLTTLSNNDGESLSAYQGKVLNDNKLARDSIDSVEGTGKNNSLYNCISFYSGDSTGQITKGNDTVILQCVGYNSVFLLDMNKLKSVIDFNDAEDYKICDFSSIGSSQFSFNNTDYSTHINGGKIYGTFINGRLVISVFDNNNNEIFYTDANNMPPYVYIHMQTNQSVMQMTMTNIDNIVGTVEINAIANIVYPVGSIYMSMSSTSPQTLFGGVWEQLKDRFLLGVGDTYSAGSTGGSSTVALTKAQMPRHNHTQAQHRHKQGNKYSDGTGSAGAYTYSSNRKAVDHYTDYQTPVINHTGGTGTTNADANGSPHENMPPYLTVYMWKRIV